MIKGVNETQAQKQIEKKDKKLEEKISNEIKKEPEDLSIEKIHQTRVDSAVDRSSASNSSLGTLKPRGESEISGAADPYWKNVPLQNTPSKGLFYDDVEITIRSAEVAEIRHWSTIDEDDFLDMDDKMNFILEKCIRVKNKKDNTWLSFMDIKEIDRFYFVFLIHELTFPHGENKLYVKFKCPPECLGDGTYREKLHLQSSMLNIFNIPEELEKYYNSELKRFVIDSTKFGETLHFYVPSVGVAKKFKNKVREARKNEDYVDEAFMRVGAYMVDDYHNLDSKKIEELRSQSFDWGKDKFLAISWFVNTFENAVNLIVKKECPQCGVQLEAPLFFRGGFTIKDLFAISGGINDLI